ncbi:M48 family metalloprotease [Rhodobacterales bacterium HKCCE3408]|nr:M48 family metalloprotease [Rhodobacterales bacterium HKCCE3408]
MRTALAILALSFISGCVAVAPPAQYPVPQQNGNRISFAEVASRIEPVAESECRAQLARANCDFEIAVDDTPDRGINAFQTIDRSGRPIIVVTVGLIAAVENADELAFVIGHEAAHHIRQHIPQQVDAARRGALVAGVLAQMGGADAAGIRQAAEIGAQVGARRFSQDHELQADELGTIITIRAGYDAVRGAGFFDRLPDPGDRFLGTHPPNASRQAIVRQTAAGL